MVFKIDDQCLFPKKLEYVLNKITDEEIYCEKIEKMLSKKIKDKKSLFILIMTILDIVRIDYNIDKEINNILSEYKVKFDNEDQKQFDEIIN